MIIDDCSHIGVLTENKFLASLRSPSETRRHLRDRGLGAPVTGTPGRMAGASGGNPNRNPQFWRGNWGRRIFPSHQFGLPGFIKQLVDEWSRSGDITHGPEKSATRAIEANTAGSAGWTSIRVRFSSRKHFSKHEPASCASNAIGSFRYMHRRLFRICRSRCSPQSHSPRHLAQTHRRHATAPPVARFPLARRPQPIVRKARLQESVPCVVQIFSTGYAPITSEDGEATNTQSLLSRQQATGAGVIVSPDGYIVTNSHVISGGRKIQVKVLDSVATLKERRDGRTFNAKVIGVDRDTDLALLKVDRTDACKRSSSETSNELRQGQSSSMAFGNPLGLESTVTLGVVQLHPPPVEARRHDALHSNRRADQSPATAEARSSMAWKAA